MSHQDNHQLQISLAKEKYFSEIGLLEQKALVWDKEIFDIEAYNFLKQMDTPTTVHKNLWDQAKLNMNVGLYQIYPSPLRHKLEKNNNGQYPVAVGSTFQIRGFDIANMTLTFDGEGWIVMDVLTTQEAAQHVWENVIKPYLGDHAITTLIYSHSHADHYGGAAGLLDYFLENHHQKKKDKLYQHPHHHNKPIYTQIIAPKGFTEHAVSENIYVGAAMARRAIYQFGQLLEIGPEGNLDCGLGKSFSKGQSTLIKPTIEIGFEDYENDKNHYKRTINALTLYLQYTPGTEAPAEMNVYLPMQQVLFIAENCAGTQHNALTPRGAQVRDLLMWATFLDQTLIEFPQIEILCSAHNWPRFGNFVCQHFIGIQRDMYRYIHNMTLHLVNLGYTIDEVGRMISGDDGTCQIPTAFESEWCCHGFYGTFNHNAKAIYQRYIGWYDGNPAHLNQHKPKDRANRYVSTFGSIQILQAANKALIAQDYHWAIELYDYLLNADEKLTQHSISQVRHNYAKALKTLGHESESALWRNMYLTAAREVEDPLSFKNLPPLIFDPTTIASMTLEMILQYLGIMLNGSKVTTDNYQLQLAISVSTGQTREFATAEVRSGILHYRLTHQLLNDKADVTIKGDKVAFFNAFAQHDVHALHQLVKAKEIEKTQHFIENYLIQFPLNFPVMTAQNKFDE
ncbi:MAG: MBL fold metallo-hydrolase [Defluviitaleaceae bacterium]|nr:MBL fold metallo-hydrolase [Defluviitaleaceae bacterium]